MEHYMDERTKVRFSDISFPLKVAVILGTIFGVFTLFNILMGIYIMVVA